MSETKYVTGVFSVYASDQALDFNQSASYPIGLELIFRNDTHGREFAHKFKQAVAALPETERVFFQEQGDTRESVVGFDCFFKNTDALRKALSPALNGIQLLDEQTKRIVPQNSLVAASQRIMTSTQQPVFR